MLASLAGREHQWRTWSEGESYNPGLTLHTITYISIHKGHHHNVPDNGSTKHSNYSNILQLIGSDIAKILNYLVFIA